MTSIRKAPINVQNVITYDAVIGVSNADLKLFPGMTANVKIVVNQRPNVLRVPNAALRYHPASETAAAARAGKGRTRAQRQRRRSGPGRQQQAAARCRHNGRKRRHVHRDHRRRPERRRSRDCRRVGHANSRASIRFATAQAVDRDISAGRSMTARTAEGYAVMTGKLRQGMAVPWHR